VGPRVAEEQVEGAVAEHAGSIAAPPRGVKLPPVGGRETAGKALDPQVPSNALIERADRVRPK
jgi:hypothetical protein